MSDDNFNKNKSNKLSSLTLLLQTFCDDYNFTLKNVQDTIYSIQVKNSVGELTDWIILNSNTNKVKILGNTDNCNLWFCDTRKDFTPEKIIEMTGDLNIILMTKFDCYADISTLIDPEDWQQIAQVQSAYEDNRYKIHFKSIEFGNVNDNDNYIYFTILEENDNELDGLFRIHDPDNGEDMHIVSINIATKKEMDFINAHYGEIENTLQKIAQKQINNIQEESEEEEI